MSFLRIIGYKFMEGIFLMNLANSETKVGLFTIFALLAIISLFLWLSGTQIFQRGANIEVVFNHIEGLKPGAAVQFAGVDIGRVSRIYLDGFQVIVVIRIKPGVTLPHPAKVLIASSTIIGDKFLEIIPAGPNEKLPAGNRLLGVNPVTMEQFYATAFDVLDSLRTVAESLKAFVTDPEVTASLKNTVSRLDNITAALSDITGQLQQIDMVQLFGRISHITDMLERIVETNDSQLNEFVSNITKISVQLAETTTTANRFLKEIDNNGQTAADLKQTIANAEKITADLDKFTTILANKQENIEQLLDDAHETMQAIKSAADSVNKALNQLTSNDQDVSQIKQTISKAGQAMATVNKYMTTFEQLSLKNSIGASYQNDSSLMIDYKMDLHVNSQNSLFVGWDDIGRQNTASLQWAFKSPNYIRRVGIYKNQFGLGLDMPVSSRFLLGINAWDVHSPNLGLTTNWAVNPDWSLAIGGDSNLETKENNWNFELWRNF
jgi:phospholipid/cholesterol/gamma-HCH transport system substrate-binding protein